MARTVGVLCKKNYADHAITLSTKKGSVKERDSIEGGEGETPL